MSYVPNATDATEPVGSRFVSSAAPEFRALKARVNALASGGVGGGGSDILGGLTIPDFTMDQATPNQKIIFADTNPLGWNSGFGRMDVQFDMRSNGYFAANPTGHIAVVLRCETGVIDTAVRGQGIAIGDFTGLSTPTDLKPTPIVESWHNSSPGAPDGNSLWTTADGARSKGGILDGQLYRFMISAICTQASQRFIRYSMWRWNGTDKMWIHEVDSGDIHDANVWADLTQSGLVIGHVFPTVGATWSVNFQSVKVTWGPSETYVPDQTSKLSRFGAELEGNLRFLGAARRTLISSNDVLPSNWHLHQAQDGAATRVGAGPSAGGNTAEFIALGNTGVNYVGQSIGISAGRGYIRSYRSGSGAVVPLDFWLEGSVRATMETTQLTLFQNLAFNGARKITATADLPVDVAGVTNIVTFKSTGTRVRSATKDIGGPLTLMTGITNWDSAAAQGFGMSAFDWGALCSVGTIASIIGGTYNASNLENAFRPLYCVVSNLVAELRARRVFRYSTDGF